MIKLKNSLLRLSAVVEDSLRKAITSIHSKDIRLAKEVIDSDPVIDKMEVELEEECLKILALHQPVAIDLRLIVSTLKINNDLERIGDLASNISERAFFLAGHSDVEINFDFRKMSDEVQGMLKSSMDSMVNMDTSQARKVCSKDEMIDAMHRECLAVIRNAISSNPSLSECYMAYMSYSRYLERIADHTTNIAEDVIYMLDGEVVRHRVEV